MPEIMLGKTSSGAVVPLQVDADGKLAIEITAEGLALDVSVDGLEAGIGATNETSAAADNSTSGLNGLVKRALARLTTLFGYPATATRTSVASVTTAGGVTILASNSGRKGATITNTDANALYLMFAAAGTVAASDFDVKLLTDETLTLAPGEYTGVVSGVWAADGSGHAKVCEFSA